MKLTKIQLAFLESLKTEEFNGEYLWCECLPHERRTADSLGRRGLVEVGEATHGKYFLARYKEF